MGIEYMRKAPSGEPLGEAPKSDIKRIKARVEGKPRIKKRQEPKKEGDKNEA